MTVETVTTVQTDVATEEPVKMDLAEKVQKILNMPTELIAPTAEGYLFDPELIVSAFTATDMEPVVGSFGDAMAKGCALSALSAWKRQETLGRPSKRNEYLPPAGDIDHWLHDLVKSPAAYRQVNGGIMHGFDSGETSKMFLKRANEAAGYEKMAMQASATAARAKELLKERGFFDRGTLRRLKRAD